APALLRTRGPGGKPGAAVQLPPARRSRPPHPAGARRAPLQPRRAFGGGHLRGGVDRPHRGRPHRIGAVRVHLRGAEAPLGRTPGPPGNQSSSGELGAGLAPHHPRGRGSGRPPLDRLERVAQLTRLLPADRSIKGTTRTRRAAAPAGGNRRPPATRVPPVGRPRPAAGTAP